MLDRRSILLSACVALCVAPALAGSVPKALDPDADGTIDLAEAKTAAGALFDKLDKDHEGTLDIKELQGRVSKADLARRRSGQGYDADQGRISRFGRKEVQGGRSRQRGNARRQGTPQQGGPRAAQAAEIKKERFSVVKDGKSLTVFGVLTQAALQLLLLDAGDFTRVQLEAGDAAFAPVPEFYARVVGSRGDIVQN